jgi:hypothetical protein
MDYLDLQLLSGLLLILTLLTPQAFSQNLMQDLFTLSIYQVPLFLQWHSLRVQHLLCTLVPISLHPASECGSGQTTHYLLLDTIFLNSPIQIRTTPVWVGVLVCGKV